MKHRTDRDESTGALMENRRRSLGAPIRHQSEMTRRETPPLRVLIAKAGLDGHDRGVKIVTRTLRDAGVEVIYLGIHNTAEEIVSSALQEDVDAIGLSIHSAAHLTLFKEIATKLKKHQARHIVLFGGGIVPADDLPVLKRLGVKKMFSPGASLEEIVRFVKALPARRFDLEIP